MNVENIRENSPQNNPTKSDAETCFHMAFGWMAALSVMIAAAALEII